MLKNEKKSSWENGFTLIELMIALLIFSVIMLALIKGEVAAIFTQSGNLFREEAVRLAEDQISSLKNTQYSGLIQSTWSAPATIKVKMRGTVVDFFRSVQITDMSTTSTAMKMVEVTVGWNQGTDATQIAPTNKNHQLSLTTIITRSEGG